MQEEYVSYEKDFGIDAIISITSGRKYTKEMKDIMELVSFVNNMDDNIRYNYYLYFNKAKFFILQQYPNLRGIGIYNRVISPKDAIDYVKCCEKEFGSTLNIKSIPTTKKSKIIPFQDAYSLSRRKTNK